MGFKQLICLSVKVQQYLKYNGNKEYLGILANQGAAHRFTHRDETIPQRETNEGGKRCCNCSNLSIFAYMPKLMHLRQHVFPIAYFLTSVSVSRERGGIIKKKGSDTSYQFALLGGF